MFGVVVILAAILFVLIYSKRYKWLALPLAMAFVLRLSLLFGEYLGIWVVPGNGEDSEIFMRWAVYWSSLRWDQLLSEFSPSASYVYAWMGAIVFKCFGYHSLTLPAINLLAGVGVVAIAGRVAQKLWDSRAGRWAAFVVALFPFEMFNSVVVLREELPIFFFGLGILMIVRWGAGGGISALVLSMLAFAVATLFHSGWLAAVVGLATYLLASSVRSAIAATKTKTMARAAFQQLLFSLVILIPSGLLIPYTDISLSKGINLGEIDVAQMSERINAAFEGSRGGSAYPAVISQGDPFSTPWLIPAKFVYFLYSPFPWDIASPRHLGGLVAGALYFWLSIRIFRLRRTIIRRREMLAVLAVVGAVALAFSIGTNNVGTSIRHRTKILVGLVVLAAGRSMDRRTHTRVAGGIGRSAADQVLEYR